MCAFIYVCSGGKKPLFTLGLSQSFIEAVKKLNGTNGSSPKKGYKTKITMPCHKLL